MLIGNLKKELVPTIRNKILQLYEALQLKIDDVH